LTYSRCIPKLKLRPQYYLGKWKTQIRPDLDMGTGQEHRHGHELRMDVISRITGTHRLIGQ